MSAVSIWEIAIKAASSRLDMRDPMDEWVPRLIQDWGVRPLAVTFEHAISAGQLPRFHADPFDRMLVAQAQCEGLTLVTVDPAIQDYDLRTMDAST